MTERISSAIAPERETRERRREMLDYLIAGMQSSPIWHAMEK